MLKVLGIAVFTSTSKHAAVMRGGEMARRGRLVAFFALLAAICVAAPVLAESPAEEPGSSDPLELRRDESLETPQAVAEREDSEYAYANLTAGQEASLLQDLFAPQLEAIDADPARALAGVTIERLDSTTEALVTLDGAPALLESEVPLRAAEEDGDLRKVELGLEETPAGYEPANPLVDLSLPANAQDPIGIGDEGLAITPVGTTAAPAAPIGEEDLLLPAAHEDTSYLLSPIAGGLELSAMLASRNSPEELDFDITLPQGASLRAGEGGGAEVVGTGGESIATITAPHAVDAQGTEVPAALAVEGNTLSILVPHRELDLAYPLFVDPEFVEEIWTGFADTSKLAYWHWSWSGVAGAEDYIGRTSCIVTCWGNGLYVRARSGFTYPAGSWGRWWFTPQGSTTYMSRVVLGPINYDAHGCTANEPHGYVGVWNDNGSWVVRNNAFPSGWATSVDVGNLPPGSRTAFVGIHAESSSKLNCGRDYRLGGASLYLKDTENPSAGTTSGYPTGWVKAGTNFTVSAPASDPGVGLKKASLYPAQAVTQVKELGCDGHYSNPCPANYTFLFPTGAGSFDEGEKTVQFSTEDALGKPSNTHTWTMKVDRTPPEIELAGQLAQATDETEGDGKDDKDKPLPLPVYNLTVNTTDGVLNPSNGGQKRSGVKKIQVFIDNRPTPEQTWEASSCSAGNCPLSKVFTLKLNELSADTEHYLRVLATDFASNAPRERKLEFEYIPATGMKDEYVMQYFPLPDGSGNEAEEEHPSRPELAVNLVSGNLVYRQEDLDVSGAAADLELELFYNSLLPEQQDTEWGDGWTLAQTPELEIEEPGAPGPPSEATIVDESAMVESKVDLPASVGEEEFDKRLQATVTKEAGGYALTDESGETGETVSFDSSGRAEELTNGTAATVEYDYEGGDLSAITIEDPGTAHADPESIDEGEAPRPLDFLHTANFGSKGSADGQLQGPADVAADPQGNIWVLDAENGRVQKFGPDGQFISKFGSPGSAEGQLNNPSSLAIDGEGNVLVADSFRIQKFSPTGQLLLKFGSQGSGDGQFPGYPTSVAVGVDGSIWASDFTRVNRYNASGQFIERIGASGPGQVSWSESIAIGPGGEVFVADPVKDRIKVFDKEGDYLRQIGTSGTGPGQLAKPVDVSIDDEGRVWVADEQTDRVQVFSPEGDYVAGFGGSGSGAEQLDLWPKTGIAALRGRIWIADGGNNRVSRWASTRINDFFHSANFGAFGSEDGQLKSPADVIGDSQGNLWVLDRDNSRIERFGPEGQFLAKFGSAGTGTGQLNYPSAITLDADGNVLVAESNRVQKLSPSGEYLAKFGALGSGNGQFLVPSGIAVGVDGTIWVTDANRVQRFTAAGQFVERVGASGAGQITWPEGIAAGPGGEMFVVDPSLDKVKVFDKEGDFLRQFGASGTGPGQLAKPVDVAVDSEGRVWVADEQTDRVQLFNAAGDYIAGFGASGSAADRLDLEERSGIAIGTGRVWVADPGNDRIDEWVGGTFEPSVAPVLVEDDPQLDVNVSDGLVDSVEGEESGTIDYEHSGDLLTAVDAPDGEAQFSYDGAGRMTKATLPNGTYGEIAYEATYGRVKSVTVAVEGDNPKTTYFSWSDEPHRTTVTPPDAPATTYDIAADGSIFKWWNAKQPPVIDDLAGTLYDNRETSSPIATGVHNLVIQAHDDEGVASIQVIANNNQLVDERNCAYEPEKPTECVTETNEWVTETGNWPPGIVYLEVIATDRLGEASSQRFWINVPYTPPPDPEAEEPPRFSDILRFREEHGLDLDLEGDEQAINDRVFESIGDWHNPTTPAGEVARASMERWGVPLRAVDVAELDYRNSYVSHDGAAIRQWGEQQVASSYAGYFVDHRAGGIIYVAMLGNEAERQALLASLASDLIAPNRVRPALGAFGRTEGDLKAIGQIVLSKLSAGGLSSTVGSVETDVPTNRVVVSAKYPDQVEAQLGSEFGTAVQVIKGSGPTRRPARFSRINSNGEIQAGDYVYASQAGCTAGFGAWDQLEAPKSNDQELYVPFQLTAGHCFPKNGNVYRGFPEEKKALIGKVTRRNYVSNSNVTTLDAEAIRTNWSDVGRFIFLNKDAQKAVIGYRTPEVGQRVCVSGATTEKRLCGPVLDEPKIHFGSNDDGEVSKGIEIPIGVRVKGGDSGGPAWFEGTGEAAGLITASGADEYGYGSCEESSQNFSCPITYITTIQQIVSGTATLYNAKKLSDEGATFPEPLYIAGLTFGK